MEQNRTNMKQRPMENPTEQIDLLELLMVLQHRLLWIIISALLAGTIAMGYTAYRIAPLYRASIRMIVNSKRDAYTNLTVSDVTSAEALVSTYAAVIKNNRVMDRVIERMDLNMSWTELNGMVSVQAVDNTPVMDIVVTCGDPYLAQEIVTTIAEVAPELIVDAVEAGSCKVISDPYCSGSPVSPDVRQNTLRGGLMGAAVAVGIIVLLHLLNDRIHSEEQLEQITETAMLSTIPRVGKTELRVPGQKRQHKTNQDAILTEKSPFNMTEAYVRLRTNFIFATMNGTYRSIVFTSCESGEGKSTLVVNLGVSLAKIGKKVLVLDCDMRKSKLYHYLNIPEGKEKGLADVLSNLKGFDDCVVHHEQLNMDILFAGRNVPNPSELVSSEKMTELLEMACQRYDYVLLDAPPILSVSEAAILSNQCDGTIFLVQHEQIRKKQIYYALQALKNAGSKILGVVMSQYDLKKDRSHYGYSGKYYYKYYYSSQPSRSGKKS